MSDVICIVAFRTDTDRAVRYKKIPIGFVCGPAFAKVEEELYKAYVNDKADFVSIRFIRQPTEPKSEGERG